MAKWFVSHERTWRTTARPLILETKGSMTLPDSGFTLTGKADRIDRMLGEDGPVVVIDYKTGSVPRARDILQGLSPQLPLEAAMIKAGAFDGIPAGTDVGHLAHWAVGGNGAGGKDHPVKADPEQLAEDALAGLARLVSVFADPATPYLSLPRPAARPRYNDYAQLARVQEWVVLDESGDGGGE
jgi:ATP-dependent helicase/nuclease subunit B